MHRYHGKIYIKFRINLVKHFSGKVYLVLKNQAKIGSVKYYKINQWFMKKIKELKIELWIYI